MQLNEKEIQHIKDIIDKHTAIRIDGHGDYYVDIDADANDELSDDIIKQIVESDNPMEEFYDSFEIDEFEVYERDIIVENIEEHWNEEEYGDYADFQDKIEEWINENIIFQFDYDHYLNQDICVNLLVNTGDGNFDFTCNNFMSYDGMHDKTIAEESSILWLVRQQGYKKTDLNRLRKGIYDKENSFLDSIHTELINPTSSMNALVFLVKMTLKEFLEYKENPTDIIVDNNTYCGLVDFWQGAGSMIDIELDNSVLIPKKFVEAHVDGCRGYGIRDIYGTDDSWWHDTIVKQK